MRKNQRCQARRTYLDYQNEERLQNALPELDKLLSRDFARWSDLTWIDHWNLVSQLHYKWKKEYDSQLRTSKQAGKDKIRSEVFSTAPGSKSRRSYHLLHKNSGSPLPAVMKDPSNASKMITGHAVNETWGSLATATRPKTMPENSTEAAVPPWLSPDLWADIKEQISPLQKNLMAPLTRDDLREFLKSTGRSAPGIDRIQYDVLRFMCLNESLTELDIGGILLRFLNVIIRQRQVPASMKQDADLYFQNRRPAAIQKLPRNKSPKLPL